MSRETNEESARIVREANGDVQGRRIMAPIELLAGNRKQTHIHPAAITELGNVKTGIRLEGMSESGIEIEVIEVIGVTDLTDLTEASEVIEAIVDVVILKTDHRGGSEVTEVTYLMSDRDAENVMDRARDRDRAKDRDRDENESDHAAHLLLRKESQPQT